MAELVDRDTEQLNVLALLHYAAAGVTALIACFPLIHVTMGATLLFFPGVFGDTKGAAPREAGLVFMAIGSMLVAAGWLFAAGHFLVARSLKARRRYIICVAISGLTCFVCMFSSGIVSVATLVVLFRPGVRQLFDSAGSIATAPRRRTISCSGRGTVTLPPRAELSGRPTCSERPGIETYELGMSAV